MCGLIAILSRTRPVAPETMGRGLSIQRHRGPDDEKFRIVGDGRVGLGHVRLGIIDPTNGAQPIASEDGAVHLVCSGEFYDFERIRRQLLREGHVFGTGSDSEIAVHLYEKLGTDCLRELHGEFAFVIWDEKRRRLFAARDRFGIKPLFFARTRHAVHLASEVKALFAAGVTARWDHAAVHRQLFLCMTPERTLFEGVRQLPAGHYLLATEDDLRIEPYWEPDFPRLAEVATRASTPARRGFRRVAGTGAGTGVPTAAECAEELRALLDEAVRTRLRADVPVGCYVSGGVDSSTVMALAHRHAPGAVTAFTVGFEGAGYDEGRYARRVADHLGAGIHPVTVSEGHLSERFAEAVWHAEGMHYNLHGIPRLLLSEAVRRAGHKVVLAGEGADECFASYGFCRAALAASGNRRRGSVPRFLAALLRPPSGAAGAIARVSPWLGRACRAFAVSEDLLEDAAGHVEVLHDLFADDFRRGAGREDPFRVLLRETLGWGRLRGRAPVHQLLQLWLKTVFPNYILGAERLDMANAVEVRLPFLDTRVFEFARRIPLPILAAGEKLLLRDLARELLPAAVADRPKQPFFVPAGRARSEVLDRLTRDLLAPTPFFDLGKVEALLRRRAGQDARTRARSDAALAMISSLCVLRDRYALS